MAAWIAGNGVVQVVDTTHPFASRISHNAALACFEACVPLLAVRRPAWERSPDDRWIDVDDMPAAATALGDAPRRVFLTIGRQELAAFANAPQHTYYVRTIEPAGDALPVPDIRRITARGPFARADEAAFLEAERIEVLVSKNAGGAATYAKIEAARDLGLPIVMVRRPVLPDVPSVPDARTALARLLADQPGTLRRV